MEKIYRSVNGQRSELSADEQAAYEAQCAAAEQELASNAWVHSRINAYGSWQQQLDEIFHDIDAWKSRIQSIKDNHPKTGN